MTHYTKQAARSDRRQMLIMLAVGVFAVALLTIFMVATSMTGVPAGPLPAPAPGLP